DHHCAHVLVEIGLETALDCSRTWSYASNGRNGLGEAIRRPRLGRLGSLVSAVRNPRRRVSHRVVYRQALADHFEGRRRVPDYFRSVVFFRVVRSRWQLRGGRDLGPNRTRTSQSSKLQPDVEPPTQEKETAIGHLRR